jgi:hypothetical protein
MKCIINRRAQFSASHRYWLSELSDAENARRFGPCINFPGHGHNYVLYVAMAGDLDEFVIVPLFFFGSLPKSNHHESAQGHEPEDPFDPVRLHFREKHYPGNRRKAKSGRGTPAAAEL